MKPWNLAAFQICCSRLLWPNLVFPKKNSFFEGETIMSQLLGIYSFLARKRIDIFMCLVLLPRNIKAEKEGIQCQGF